MDPINIQLLVQEFFAFEAISAMLATNQCSNFEPMRHSHSRWYRDFNYFRDEYINKFASAIFDYTVLVVAAELRHCRDKASQYINKYYNSWDHPREEVYDVGSEYNANDILMAGIRMFDTKLVNWRSSYGGEKWKQIAKAGLMKGKVSDCIFIDHCIDLSHNNSVYFDKGAGIFCLQNTGDYQLFLDLKCSCKPQVLIKPKQGYAFNRLIWRANNLNIIEERPTDGSFSLVFDKTEVPLFEFVEKQPTDDSSSHNRDEAESLLFDYHPVKWGNKRLDYSESNILTRGNLDYRMRRKYDREDDRGYDREYGQAA